MAAQKQRVLYIHQAGIHRHEQQTDRDLVSPSLAWGSSCLSLALLVSRPTTQPNGRFCPAATVAMSRE